MAHHLPRNVREGLVVELARVCRSAYVFDVEITLLGIVSFHLAPLVGLGLDTTHDAVISVRRGFTKREFEDMVRPLPVRVRRVFPSALCTVPA